MAKYGTRGDYKRLDQQGEEVDQVATVLARVLVILAGFVLVFGATVYVAGIRYVDPRFSIQIQGLEGLDPSRNSTVSAPAFHLAIHVDNKHHIRQVCYDDMAAVVYYNEGTVGYNETSVGWSRLPAFCVDRYSAVDLDVSLPKDGVFLSQRLRDRMAHDRKGQGMELSVEIKPIDLEDSAGSGACFHACDTRLGESPVAAPCDKYC